MRNKRSNDEFAEMFDRLIERTMAFLQVVIFVNIVVLIVAQILKAL